MSGNQGAPRLVPCELRPIRRKELVPDHGPQAICANHGTRFYRTMSGEYQLIAITIWRNASELSSQLDAVIPSKLDDAPH
jgi:hypothetical protein